VDIVRPLTNRPAAAKESLSNQHRGALRLQVATIAWNSGEVFVTIALGVAARSLALVAFGLDSLIEVFTSVVVLWHMGDTAIDGSRPDAGNRDRNANRLVAAAFTALAMYLIVSSTRSLVLHSVPDRSLWGIIYLAVTALVMLALARLKRRSGRGLANDIYLAEARMTQLDAYLAVSIMTALLTNGLFGWWWADALSAGGVGLLAAVEAVERARASNADRPVP